MSSPLGLPPKQLSSRIGKSVRALWQWRQNGKGPPFIRVEGRIHYPEDALASWLKRNTRKDAA